MGDPKRLIVDIGSNFSGKKWDMMSNLFGMSIIIVPVDSHHSIGRVERQARTVNCAYQAIEDSVGSNVPVVEKLTMAVLARNITPLPSSSISPMYALNGRPSILGQMTHAAVLPSGGDRYDSEERQMRNRMCAINVARNKILEMDAKRTLKLSLHRNSLIASPEHYREGDTVDIWVSRKKKRQGSFRVLYDSGRAVIVENLGALFKHPKNWARLRERDEGITTPDVGTNVPEKTGSSNGKSASSKDIPVDSPSERDQEDEAGCTTITGEVRRGSSLAKTKLKKKKIEAVAESKELPAKTNLHSAHMVQNRLSLNCAQVGPVLYPQFISCLMDVQCDWGGNWIFDSRRGNDHREKRVLPSM